MSEAVLSAPVARSKGHGEALAAWLLSLPAVIAYVLMILLPTLAAVAMAFTDYELGVESFHWVGLDNFAELLADRGQTGDHVEAGATNRIAAHA